MPARRQRRVPPPDREGGARLLDAHDDYRVLRRLKPRPVDPVDRLRPGESVALVIDVDHRQHEVIETGMVASAPDTTGRIGPVVGVRGMLHKPNGEISAETPA